ncbi:MULTISPECIES: hypothetical protein [Bacillus]|nr:MULTISPECIES: hypothetical protein [Bacillus cereus group]TKH97706.1 hypothetical protein FC693_13350 [Bacillus cereus]
MPTERSTMDATEDAMKRRQQRGNNNKGIDKRSGNRKKSDTREKKRKQVEREENLQAYNSPVI